MAVEPPQRNATDVCWSETHPGAYPKVSGQIILPGNQFFRIEPFLLRIGSLNASYINNRFTRPNIHYVLAGHGIAQYGERDKCERY